MTENLEDIPLSSSRKTAILQTREESNERSIENFREVRNK
jgi:hypothetical protein